jgi:hypothetical protein
LANLEVIFIPVVLKGEKRRKFAAIELFAKKKTVCSGGSGVNPDYVDD